MAPQQTLLIRYFREVFIQHLLGIDYRANLQEIKFPRTVAVQIDRKLNLHRTPHRLCTIVHCHLQQFREREDILL